MPTLDEHAANLAELGLNRYPTLDREEYRQRRTKVLREYGARELAKLKAAGIEVPDPTPEELERLGASVADHYDQEAGHAVLAQREHRLTGHRDNDFWCHCPRCWTRRQEFHRGHRHAANESCPHAPPRGSGWPDDDHRQSTADQPQTAPERHTTSAPKIERPFDSADLEQGPSWLSVASAPNGETCPEKSLWPEFLVSPVWG